MTLKFTTLPRQRAWNMGQTISQTITPTPVLPISGPTAPDQAKAAFNDPLISANVVREPIIKTPILEANTAAAATPSDFAKSVCVFICNTPANYRIGATLLRKAPKDPATAEARNAIVNRTSAALRRWFFSTN